jgi:glucose/arabinose dehydrogenase
MTDMARLRHLVALLALALVLAACGGGSGPPPTPTPTPVPKATPTPSPAPTATESPEPTPPPAIPNTMPATELSLPEGFTAYPIAEGFFRPTSIALSPDGNIYISERHGNVFRLQDGDGDGVFEENVLFTSGYEEITGIAAAPQGPLYVSSRGRVTTVRDTDGNTVGDVTQDIIAGLPNGRHQNNGLVFGPDGKLYITNGSTCDECDEADERSATILQANLDGSGLRVYARGLRNSYDLVFDPQGRLWATDNGSDEPCATIDELNLIEDGGDYGWPYGEVCDPFQSGIPPAADLGLHTASTGIDAYDGEHFPEEYRGNLFVTLWGSFAFEPEFPPVLLRIVIDGTPGVPQARVEQFGTGFQNPIDVVVDGDGTLLVLDYGSGKLYRIIHTGG